LRATVSAVARLSPVSEPVVVFEREVDRSNPLAVAVVDLVELVRVGDGRNASRGRQELPQLTREVAAWQPPLVTAVLNQPLCRLRDHSMKYNCGCPPGFLQGLLDPVVVQQERSDVDGERSLRELR
jgi:hypothetical protein